MIGQRGRRYVFLFLAAWRDFGRNNCTYIAAGIAYWTVLSIFPLILGGLAILGYLLTSSDDQQRVIRAVLDVIPVSAGEFSETIADLIEQRGTLGIVAALGALWSGTAVFSAVRRGINHTWGVRHLRSFLVGRAADFLMFLFFAAAALLLLAYTTIGNITVESLPDWARGLPVFNFSTRIVVELGAFAGTWAVFMLLYRFVPRVSIEWGDVWLGAAVGAALFQLIRIGFAWFAAHIGNFNVVYGSLGALVAVMVWAYTSSMAVLLGSQIAATYAKTMGSLSTPEAAVHLETEYGDLLSREAWLKKLQNLRQKAGNLPTPFKRSRSSSRAAQSGTKKRA